MNVYIDGACSGNPGPGGWGAILTYNGHRGEISGFEARSTNNRFERNRALLSDIVRLDPDELLDVLGTTRDMARKRYQAAKVHSTRSLDFKSQRLDPERVLELVSSSALWKEFHLHVEPSAASDIVPLAPMRQGHLAMLVAAGFCNGVELADPENPERELLIKGTVKRVSETAPTEQTETHEVTRIIHTHKIRVRMLRVDEARVEEIE